MVGIKVEEGGKPAKESTFLGFDFPSKEVKMQDMTEEIRKNKELYKMAGQFSMRGYDATIDPNKKTIGIPMVLVMFKFFTLANEFFKDLGYNVVMSHVLGGILEAIEREGENRKSIQFLIPFNEGADADGQYARAIRTVLDCKGYEDVDVIAPMLERLPVEADDPDLLMRALVAGDILYSAPAESRDDQFYRPLSGWDALTELAGEIGKVPVVGRTLGVVGTPMSISSLDEGILEKLEYEAETFHRAPLSEMMWFLWKDCGSNGKAKDLLASWKKKMMEIGVALNDRSSFAEEPEELFEVADKYLSDFSGANGRYRYAKMLLLAGRCNAMIHMSPRYENTSMVLNMRGLHDNCKVPVYNLSLDGDFDESGWERLRSFLYYCG